jgi:arylsulfatase
MQEKTRTNMFGMMAVHKEIAEYFLDDQKLDALPGDFYATCSYTDFSIDSIRSNRADVKPFLAHLAFTAPHDPMHVPKPWLSKYRDNYDDDY